jgi:hypothetical protein
MKFEDSVGDVVVTQCWKFTKNNKRTSTHI